MHADRPLGFTWTPGSGWLAGVVLEHGREIVATPGRKRALEFSAVRVPPDHEWAEDGRYEYVCPVYLFDAHPLLQTLWEAWRRDKGKGEVREVYVGPRTPGKSGNPEADHYTAIRTQLARARAMTHDGLPRHCRWGMEKLRAELRLVDVSEGEFEAYQREECAEWQ